MTPQRIATNPSTLPQSSGSLYLGLMSGTSLDGVDAALVEFTKNLPRVVATAHTPFPPSLRERLADITRRHWQGSMEALLKLDHDLAIVLADMAQEIIASQPKRSVAAIGSHGQTVFHAPSEPIRNTWQLGDPSVIAYRTGVTTVADFRRADLAAGGQGAPLTPAFHSQVFASPHPTAVVNLGGIANITVLPVSPEQPILGFDSGPANTLLDQWIFRHQSQPYDRDGHWGASGRVDPSSLQRLLQDAYFHTPLPKSTGTDYFNLDWLKHRLGDRIATLKPADLQATLTELTAITVTEAMQKLPMNVTRVVLCGGGAHNTFLCTRIESLLPEGTELIHSSLLGIDPDFVEAIAFAWLAKRRIENIAIDLRSITGAKQAMVLGAIYPGQETSCS